MGRFWSTCLEFVPRLPGGIGVIILNYLSYSFRRTYVIHKRTTWFGHLTKWYPKRRFCLHPNFMTSLWNRLICLRTDFSASGEKERLKSSHCCKSVLYTSQFKNQEVAIDTSTLQKGRFLRPLLHTFSAWSSAQRTSSRTPTRRVLLPYTSWAYFRKATTLWQKRHEKSPFSPFSRVCNNWHNESKSAGKPTICSGAQPQIKL